MQHEIWDIIRDVSGGAILLLLGVLLNRHLARYDAQKKSDKDWRASVDADIACIKFHLNIDPDETAEEDDGLDKRSDNGFRHRRRIREP